MSDIIVQMATLEMDVVRIFHYLNWKYQLNIYKIVSNIK